MHALLIQHCCASAVCNLVHVVLGHERQRLERELVPELAAQMLAPTLLPNVVGATVCVPATGAEGDCYFRRCFGSLRGGKWCAARGRERFRHVITRARAGLQLIVLLE